LRSVVAFAYHPLVMTKDFDSWLRELDAETLAREIEELDQQRRRITGEITKRQQALDLYKAWHADIEETHELVARPEEPIFPAVEETPLAPNEIAEIESGPPEGFEVVHDMAEKETILYKIVKEAGPNGIHMRDVRRALADLHLYFEGTPERGVLWRMQQAGDLDKVRQGVYRLRQAQEGYDPEAAQIRRSEDL
jgi:hypothetical protein